MAAELVGGALLSSFLQVVFDRIVSRQVLDYFPGRKLDEKLLNNLRLKQLSINAVVMMQKKSRFKIFISFDKEIEPRMKQVLDNLELLSSLKGDLGLKEAMGVGVESGSGSKVSQKLPSTSLVVENVIYDRDADKEIIFNWLTSGADNCNQLSILSIVGMDGMGKTTLAQQVYNDPRMEEAKFDIKAWVCVSDDFDVLRVTRAILDAITKSKNEGGDLETVHEKLIRKRFLLVLDAVWNEKHKKWEAVQTPLNYGAQGKNLLQFPQQNKSLKEVGEQYYDDLLSKSFFQQSSEDEALFFMHDLLNDLAKYVCGDIYFREFGIQQLGELNLRESLSIGELQNIENPSYALAADLKNKIHLVGLRLGWNWNQNQIPDDPKKEREVLENLTFEVLEKCKYCLCLPPLGHLPFLKTLNIQRLDGIVSIDSSFHGSSSSSFTSLETLEFYCLKEWECRAVTGAFPRLQRLCIVECPKLKGSLPEQLLCLKILLFLTANSLWLLEICELELQDCGKELWEPTPLKSLYIQNLDVESFPDEGLLPLSLKRIQIDKCRNLLNFYNKGLCQLSSLEELSLGNNPNLQCLPEEGLPKSISTLDILDCTLLKQRCLGPKGEDWGNIIHIKNIERVVIRSCGGTGFPYWFQNLSVAGLDGKLIIDSEFQGRHQENSEGHKIQNVVAMKKVQNPQSDKRDDQLPTRAFESPLRC
ncbi:putative disease resistance RPP13-like protein 1 [Glycine max]|nr:putative disease resistance RPP13-like protein 1 [Glycine max]